MARWSRRPARPAWPARRRSCAASPTSTCRRPTTPSCTAAIETAAGGDAVAAAAVTRLLGARELGPVGTGAFLAAARFAAARNAAAPAGERTLAREALAAHIAPLLGGLDEEGRRRLVALAG